MEAKLVRKKKVIKCQSKFGYNKFKVFCFAEKHDRTLHRNRSLGKGLLTDVKSKFGLINEKFLFCRKK